MPVLTPGATVRAYRDAKGMTRPELAAQAGVSVSTVARLELGNHLPRATALAAIAAVLDIPVGDLLAVAA